MELSRLTGSLTGSWQLIVGALGLVVHCWHTPYPVFIELYQVKWSQRLAQDGLTADPCKLSRYNAFHMPVTY